MNVLLTGTSSDISAAIKKHLEEKNHHVYSTSHHGDSETIPFDLANPNAHAAQMDQVLKQNQIEGLILNACSPTYRLAPLAEIDEAEMDSFLTANLQGNIWLLRKILPVFVKQKMGRIIFISSMNTQFPIKGYSAYAAAKAGMETVMKYTAHEYGAFNITANSLRLGIIHTQRNDKFIRRSSIREKMEASVNLKRLGKPEDLNLAIDLLLDPNCYVQGTSIEISGGLSFPQ